MVLSAPVAAAPRGATPVPQTGPGPVSENVAIQVAHCRASISLIPTLGTNLGNGEPGAALESVRCLPFVAQQRLLKVILSFERARLQK